MALFVDSLDLTRAPGAYAIEVAPPVTIEGQVIGYLGIAFAGEWGPVNVVTEPSGSAEFLAMYFPKGSPHTSTGYRALMRRKRLPLRPVRLLLNGVKASSTAAAGTGTYTVTAKYEGVLGNSIAITWKAPTDGVTAHRDLEVVLSDAVTGSTTERIRNVVAGTAPDLSTYNLLGSLTFSSASALPTAGTTLTVGVGGTSHTAGSDGDPLTSAEYEAAFALLALRHDIFVVTIDDCGNSLREDVNDALVEHVATTRNRLAVFQGCDPNETWANVKTYVNEHSPSVRSDRSLPQGAWVYVNDDAGVPRVTPWATFVASALVNLEPQQSHAWHDDRVSAFNSACAGVYAPFSTADEGVQGDATELGIGLPVRLGSGAYASLHDRTSSLTSGKRFTIRRRLTDFLARSLTTAVQSYVNGSNWRGRQLEVKALADGFLKGQGPTVRKDDPRVVEAATSLDGVNTGGSIAAGNFYLAVDAKTPSIMEKIGFLLNVGEAVTVRETT